MPTSIVISLLLASAGLVATGCKHDLSKIAPAGDAGEATGGSGRDLTSGSGKSGTGDSTGGPNDSGSEDSCEIGSSRPCQCDDGSEGEQQCQLSGTYGPCQCESSAGGTGGNGEAGIGGRGGTGGDGAAGNSVGIVPVDRSTGSGIMCRPECIGETAIELCVQYCNMFCDNMERYCDNSRCPARGIFCAPEGTVTQTCLSSCNHGDESCARAACELEKTYSCNDYAQYCLNDDASCDMNGTCRNTCKSVDDSECDDGGEHSRYSTCPWGTDCNDCGVRYGGPPPCSAIGCDCGRNGDCCGFLFGLSYCVDLGDGFPNCYATCSSPGRGECDPGFECTYTEDEEGDAHVCIPVT